MLFDLEKLSEYDPSEFKVNFNTLVKVDIKTLGYIPEKKLATPCIGTKMSIEQIFRYQENGYIIKYDDTYVEDMYFLACYYNAKLDLEHRENRSLRIKPLVRTLEILKKRLSRNPKFKKVLNDMKSIKNPFFDPSTTREIEKNISSTAKVEMLRSIFEFDHLKDNEKLDYNELMYVENELNNFYAEFRDLNKFNRDPRSEITPNGSLNKERREKSNSLKQYDI